MEKWIIKSWMGRILFDGKQFDSFDDGWSFIYETDPQLDETDNHYYDDYYVEPMMTGEEE